MQNEIQDILGQSYATPDDIESLSDILHSTVHTGASVQRSLRSPVRYQQTAKPVTGQRLVGDGGSDERPAAFRFLRGKRCRAKKQDE